MDTHILVWWFEQNARLTKPQRKVISSAKDGPPLFVSNISLWEISMLVSLGRLRIHMPLQEWLGRATAAPLVERCPITPSIAAGVAGLPESFHRDPADRILVSTARVLNAVLVTADEKIKAAKLVKTL